MSLIKWKNEILKTEQTFAKMAKEIGISEAFFYYAAEDAVLKQNQTLCIGKEAIREHFEKQPTSRINLVWTPDFVDVSKSGDLGYTYGYYIMSFTDGNGKSTNNKGIFHTVWKRQSNGTWRFVWD
jgi:ketosteroid isomerase-like protein